MKPITNPNDKKKMYGLVAACSLTFVFIGWRLMSALGGGASPPAADTPVTAGAPPAPAQVVPLSTGVTAVAGAGPVKPGSELIDVPVFLASDTPNPFHKADPNYVRPGTVPVAPPNRLAANLRGRRIRPRGGPPEPITPMAGDILPNPGGVSDTPQVRPDPDVMQVMGVATGGQNPVAVIRVGAQEYVVDKGSKFGHGLRLKDVSDTQVVIEQGGELHILRVGARPPTPAAASGTTSPPPDSKTSGST